MLEAKASFLGVIIDTYYLAMSNFHIFITQF